MFFEIQFPAFGNDWEICFGPSKGHLSQSAPTPTSGNFRPGFRAATTVSVRQLNVNVAITFNK
jgi:hypothetical protein